MLWKLENYRSLGWNELEDVLDHNTNRILRSVYNKANNIAAFTKSVLISKIGFEDSTGQQVYKQKISSSK